MWDDDERDDGFEASGSVLGERLDVRAVATIRVLSPLLGREQAESTLTYKYIRCSMCVCKEISLLKD